MTSNELPITDAEFPDPPEASTIGVPLPEIPADQLERYLTMWRIAWISGYVSAGINVLANGGAPKEIRDLYAQILEHRAVHSMRNMMEDPLVRNNVIVDAIQRILSDRYDEQQRVSGEVVVHCVDHPRGRSGEDHG